MKYSRVTGLALQQSLPARFGSNPVFEVMAAARPLFHRKRKSIGGLAKSEPTSLLADQQKKRSDANQHRNQNTDDERNNPMPTRVDFSRSSALLRRSETQPEQKFVHGDQRPSSALLCSGLTVLATTVNLPRSASAKSPNPSQGYLARRPHER